MALAVACLAARPAKAAMGGTMSTAVVGGASWVTNSGGALGYTAGLRIGAGLGGLDADIGVMWLSRAFSGSSNANYIEIPVVARFSLAPIISLGAGGYFDIALSSGNSNVVGLRGSVQISPPAFPLFVEGNYDFNLSPGSAGSLNDVQALVGIKF